MKLSNHELQQDSRIVSLPYIDFVKQELIQYSTESAKKMAKFQINSDESLEGNLNILLNIYPLKVKTSKIYCDHLLTNILTK